MPNKPFRKGDKIEVRVATNGGGVISWKPATILRWLSAIEMSVQYHTLDETLTSSPIEDTVSIDDVRPAPSTELHRYFMVGEEVEAYCTDTKGWRKSVIDEILENSAYTVLFEGATNVVRVEQWWLRAFRRWIDGAWVPPFYLQEGFKKCTGTKVKSSGLKLKIKFSGNSSKENFDEGMLVEVKGHEDGFRGSWYTAVILQKLENDKLVVEYQTLTTEDKTEFVKEEVTMSSVRPVPPSIEHTELYSYYDQVEAWFNDGWWEGFVAKIMSGFKYGIHFNHSGKEIIFDYSALRPRQVWTNGQWSVVSEVNRSTAGSSRPSQVKQKRKYNRKSSVPKFDDGTVVEVKSDEEGYQGAWFCATIVGSLGQDSFLVEYQTLKTDDNSGLLKEETSASNIRPCPPNLVKNRYKHLDEVDAWYNDGWWVGDVSKVLDEGRYTVYFWTTNEELIFGHYSLRLHQEWIGGKWTVSKKKRQKLAKARLEQIEEQNSGKGVRIEEQNSGIEEQNSGKREIADLANGMEVEVRSDQEGYVGSWFQATIVQALGSEMFLVEYQTLVTDDNTELLKEEAHSSCIRPRPPIVEKEAEYKYGEEVDAWYNEGWWIGRICDVLGASQYMVYFHSTHERMAFNHSDLRPHQDWINGQWFIDKV